MTISHDTQIILDLEGLTDAVNLVGNVLKGGGLDKHGHGKHRRLNRDEHGIKLIRHLITPGADKECGEHHAMNAASRALMIAANVHASSHTGAALSRHGALEAAVVLIRYAATEANVTEALDGLSSEFDASREAETEPPGDDFAADMLNDLKASDRKRFTADEVGAICDESDKELASFVDTQRHKAIEATSDGIQAAADKVAHSKFANREDKEPDGKPDYIPDGVPWEWATLGTGERVGIRISNIADWVEIGDDEWVWDIECENNGDFTGERYNELTPALAAQCRAFWERHSGK